MSPPPPHCVGPGTSTRVLRGRGWRGTGNRVCRRARLGPGPRTWPHTPVRHAPFRARGQWAGHPKSRQSPRAAGTRRLHLRGQTSVTRRRTHGRTVLPVGGLRAGGRLAELAARSRLPTAAREAATATCRDGSASTRRADGGPGRAGLTLTLPGSQVPGPGHVGLWGATCWPRTSGDGEPAWRTLGSMRHGPSDCRPCARGACSGLWLSRRSCWEKVPHRGR